MNGQHVSKRFRKYRRVSDLPEYLHFHSLRHTFATWYAQRGGSIFNLKELLGHSDIKTTMVYAHHPQVLRAEMEKIMGTEPVIKSISEREAA